MSEYFWLLSFLALSGLCSFVAWKCSESERWKKIVGTICILPVIYVLTGSFYTAYEFANPLVFISIPFGWLAAWLFFSNKKYLFWSMSIVWTMVELFIVQPYCDGKRHDREWERYNNYRLERQKRIEQYESQDL